jgi:hypothetical protein
MKLDDLKQRETPLELSSEEFRNLGYRLVDRIASHFETLANRRVTPGESPEAVRRAIGSDNGLPLNGAEPGALLDEITDILLQHSLFNAHPRFWGYITAGPAPIGVLADLLASAVNSNVGAWKLAPAATEIEAQTIRWIAEFIGYPVDCGGIMVSGGNMANFVCFLAARRAKSGGDVRQTGLAGPGSQRPAFTHQPLPTRGCKKLPTCSGTEQMRFAGSKRIAGSDWISMPCSGRFGWIAMEENAPSSLSATPELSVAERWIRCRTWLHCAGNMACGSMWMAPTALARPRFREVLPIWRP